MQMAMLKLASAFMIIITQQMNNHVVIRGWVSEKILVSGTGIGRIFDRVEIGTGWASIIFLIFMDVIL